VVVAIVSAFGFAAVLLLGEFLSETLGSSRSVFGGFLVSSVFWAVLQIFRGRPDTLLNPDFWPAILFLGVITTIAPFSLFVWGLGKIGAPASGITTTIEPVSGAVLAYIWLGQALTGFQIAGALAVIIGIALLQLERSSEPGVPEAFATPATADFERSGD
jgi:drug/metabolite transporter (DMT)-like permease